MVSFEDVKRLFHDLASESEGEVGNPILASPGIPWHPLASPGIQEVISLEAYKAAAQENAEFLACLGIEPGAQMGMHPTHKCRTTGMNTRMLTKV